MNTSPNNKKHIAEYWTSKRSEILCTLCPHTCHLKEGETGICRTRKNIEGKLISMVYGFPSAMQIDPIEKKPLYHFHPGSRTYSLATTGCNLRCLNCQNYHLSQCDVIHHKEQDFISPQKIIDLAKNNNCESISYTYTDPIVYYEYAKDIGFIARKNGMKNIIVSAGYINKKPLREWCSFIDAANIDLKGFNNTIYQKLNGINLNPVLSTLQTLKEAGVWIEITNLIIPGYTDDMSMIKKMCIWLSNNGFSETPIHFSRFFPSYKLNHLEPTPLSTLHNAYQIAKDAGIKYVYLGNVPDENYDNTFCDNCGETLIQRKGYHTQIHNMEGNSCSNCANKIPGIFNL